MATSIKIEYSIRRGGIPGSRMCQEAPLEDKFDLIEVKCQDVNEQVNVRIYFRDLDKDEIEVLTM